MSTTTEPRAEEWSPVDRESGQHKPALIDTPEGRASVAPIFRAALARARQVSP